MRESSLTNNNYNHQTMIVEMGGLSVEMSSGGAMFSYHGRTVSTDTSGDVHQIISGSTATVVIRDRVLSTIL